jgi:hypothetical protein
MALSLPRTPVRQDQARILPGQATGGLPGQWQMMGLPEPGRPPGY